MEICSKFKRITDIKITLKRIQKFIIFSHFSFNSFDFNIK